MRNFLYCTSILLFFLVTVSFGQDTSKVINQTWLQTIKNNAVSNDLPHGCFHEANKGYALYFSKADSLRVPYLVYVPGNYDSSKPHSLLVFLHGGVVGIDSFQYQKASFVSGEPIFSIANKYNDVVLYPFGRKDFGWVKQQAAFENIITELSAVEQIYNIDRDNVFLGGMSNGGSAAFWFITYHPELFTGFYAFSAMPKLYQSKINFKNLTVQKPLYTINAKDDEGYSFANVKSIYEQHKTEAPGWHFDSVASGDHGFIYDDSGLNRMTSLFTKVNTFSLARKAVYDSLMHVLFQVDEDDQKYRNEMDEVREKFGGKSPEMKKLYYNMSIADSLNLIIAEKIINKYGWLGADEIGSQANKALFMVIQHSDLAVQEKYLPLMRAAVKNGKADACELAMLDDRVALHEGRSQIYGSQLSWNLQTNTYLFFPIMDPENLDKRRASVGLELYADYLKRVGLVWNLDQYKKDLPKIERQFKMQK